MVFPYLKQKIELMLQLLPHQLYIDACGFGGRLNELPKLTGERERGFHLSNIMRPPRPILPWNLTVPVPPFAMDAFEGGTIPAAASFSGTTGFVNKSTGLRGSCKEQKEILFLV